MFHLNFNAPAESETETATQKKTRKKKRRIAVFDFETDPFLYGRVPVPFACGFYDGETYTDFWGDDCVSRFIAYLEKTPYEYYLYAHNGGKFDFIYLVLAGALRNPVKVINSRIVSAKINRHILRDSYAILPVPLAAHDKGQIDYTLFEREKREENKADILEYLARDCESLYALVSAFVGRFGVQLTIGGTAIKEVARLHPFERTDREHDDLFRSFYFGGRVECFERGEIHGKFKVFDVNSEYPYVMSEHSHPTGLAYYDLEIDAVKFTKTNDLKGFPGKPYFIKFRGAQSGAIPVRLKTGLDFNIPHSSLTPDDAYFCTSHEFKIAKKHNLVSVSEILAVYVPVNTIQFSEFVAINTAEKIAGKKTGDKPREIFAKLLMNSSYGKFAQNPDSFKDYHLHYAGDPLPDFETWTLDVDYGEIELYSKPSEQESYYDVATAASITGAARALLLDAIHSAKRVIYCDTDSLVCESLDAEIDPYKLGAWKFEEEIDTAYIAGKKLYALYYQGECKKLASKGVRLTGADIQRLCKGEKITYCNDAPSFKLTGSATFVKRGVKMLDKIK